MALKKNNGLMTSPEPIPRHPCKSRFRLYAEVQEVRNEIASDLRRGGLAEDEESVYQSLWHQASEICAALAPRDSEPAGSWNSQHERFYPADVNPNCPIGSPSTGKVRGRASSVAPAVTPARLKQVVALRLRYIDRFGEPAWFVGRQFVQLWNAALRLGLSVPLSGLENEEHALQYQRFLNAAQRGCNCFTPREVALVQDWLLHLDALLDEAEATPAPQFSTLANLSQAARSLRSRLQEGGIPLQLQSQLDALYRAAGKLGVKVAPCLLATDQGPSDLAADGASKWTGAEVNAVSKWLGSLITRCRQVLPTG